MQEAIITQHTNTVMFLLSITRVRFADACSFESSRINQPPPAAINRRIASLSSDKQTFDTVAPTYDRALKQSNHHTKLQFPTPDTILTDETPSENKKRKRGRNII